MSGPIQMSTDQVDMKQVLCGLLDELRAKSDDANELLDESARPIALAMAALFGGAFAAAVKMIELGNVRAVRVQSDDHEDSRKDIETDMFIIRSSRTAGCFYSVNLESWHCSCAQFALLASNSGLATEIVKDNQTCGWSWGGATNLHWSVVCKHLLACILAVHGPAALSSKIGPPVEISAESAASCCCSPVANGADMEIARMFSN